MAAKSKEKSVVGKASGKKTVGKSVTSSSKVAVKNKSSEVSKTKESRGNAVAAVRKSGKAVVKKVAAVASSKSKPSPVVAKNEKPSSKKPQGKRALPASKSATSKSGKPAKVASGKTPARKSATIAPAPVVVEKKSRKTKADDHITAEQIRSSGVNRRAKEKEKAPVKSPFSHTDHEAIFRGVEARKAAARAQQARLKNEQVKPKKGVARQLTDKQLQEFEEMLVRLKAELLRQIAYLRGASLTRADEVNTEEDGTDAFERQLALKLAAGEGDSIFEIDEAMERVREKTYGICEECACIIPAPRLKALPFARRCVECQSTVERAPHNTDHRYF
jgi:DnaK suppressor protein